MREAKVEIFFMGWLDTADVGLERPAVGSDSQFIQFAYVRAVSSRELIEDHAVVNAHHPALPEPVRRAIDSHLKRAWNHVKVSFNVKDDEGKATVLTRMQKKSPSDWIIAAAVAVVKKSWGWDEGDPIIVNVNGTDVPVRVEYDGQSHIATVVE